MNKDLTKLYQQVVMQHTKNPQNFYVLENSQKGVDENPMCGDAFKVFVKMANKMIIEISFQGHGCAISMSSASLMTEFVKNKTKREVKTFFTQFIKMLDGDDGNFSKLGDLQAFAEISKFPVRKKCAILAWNALFNAIKSDL